MKPRYILIYIFSLLLASLLPTSVYGDESSQSIGDDNNCPAQLIDSDGNNITCNIYINHPETAPSTNQPNLVPKATSTPFPAVRQEDLFNVEIPLPPSRLSNSTSVARQKDLFTVKQPPLPSRLSESVPVAR